MHKLILDENIPFSFISYLENVGYEVLHIGKIHGGISDHDVFSFSQEQQGILITYDTDFGKLLYFNGLENNLPIILLRNISKRHLAVKLLPDILQNINLDIKIIIINPPKVRIISR